jgi:hypothetical protein
VEFPSSPTLALALASPELVCRDLAFRSNDDRLAFPVDEKGTEISFEGFRKL